jgi:hypothetical protein
MSAGVRDGGCVFIAPDFPAACILSEGKEPRGTKVYHCMATVGARHFSATVQADSGDAAQCYMVAHLKAEGIGPVSAFTFTLRA